MTWDTRQEDSQTQDSQTQTVTIQSPGTSTEVSVGEPFAENVIAAAGEAGYGKVRVFLNGNNIELDEAPSLIEAEHQIMIVPEDKGAR